MCPWGNGLMCTTIVQHRRIPIVFVSRVVEDADPLLFEKLGTSVTRENVFPVKSIAPESNTFPAAPC